MKIKYFNLKMFYILLLGCYCENNSVPEPTCYQKENKAVLITYVDELEISGLSSDIRLNDYTLINVPLTPERARNQLFSCNLLCNFKKDDLNVIFSDFLFDIAYLNICA
jgi:hypothetical protein